MALHFKFRSAAGYDSVNIEGHFISVNDLRERIIEAKNLGKGMDFDLLITNAQTGEEYSDDTFLVPKNTSVIIKRVPATRAKPILRVDDQQEILPLEQTGNKHTTGSNSTALPACPDALEDGMDDFGLDLYAIPESLAATKIDAEEDIRITAMVNKTALDWQRQTQEACSGGTGRDFGRLFHGRGLARGRGYARALPPQGYVCHRCSQPGHFIQHCPTNGDPAYDIRRVKLPVGIPKTRLKADQEGGYILPDGSVAVMQPDESVFAREADAFLSTRPTAAEPPPEMRCPSCQAIFNDAVMIPCCHYSFCDKCIRQELMSNGKCPQCGSGKIKNDDLLPNIALRQAIDRFETQLSLTSADESVKRQSVPEAERDPASRSDAALAPVRAARLQIELRKPAESLTIPGIETDDKAASAINVADSLINSTATVLEKVVLTDGNMDPLAATNIGGVSVVVDLASELQSSGAVAFHCSNADESVAVVQTAIVADVSDPDEGRGMHPEIDDGGCMVVKMSDPPSHKEAEGVAVESEVSKGKKKKKRARLINGDGAGHFVSAGKGRRGDRFCFVCGSPEHLARDCLDNPENVHRPRPGMFDPGVGHPGPPPFGPDIYWQGPPMPQHGPPCAMPYEVMYGPMPVPFVAPMIPPRPYNLASYLPPMYAGASLRGGFFGGGGMPSVLGSVGRPLSREEFMEMQERERRRRLMHERLHRDRSPGKPYGRQGNWQIPTTDLERVRYEHADKQDTVDGHQSSVRKHDSGLDSSRNYSDESEFKNRKSGNYEQKQASLDSDDCTRLRNVGSFGDIDIGSFDELKTRKIQLKNQHPSGGKTVSCLRGLTPQRDENVEGFSLDREDDTPDLKYSSRHYEKKPPNDGTVHCVNYGMRKHSRSSEERQNVDFSGSGGDSHSTLPVEIKAVLQSGKYDDDEEIGLTRSTSKRPRSQNRNERLRESDVAGSESDGHGHDRHKAVEKSRRRKHRSHSISNVKSVDAVDEPAGDVKNKKRKGKRHREERSHTKRSIDDASVDVHEDYRSKHRSEHKLSSGSGSCRSMATPVDLEETRWQLDSGQHVAISSHESKRSRHRRTDSGKLK